MSRKPVVTGLSPKEGAPGTRITIRGEFLGTKATDLIGLTICGCDCLLSAEWKSPNKIIARTGLAKGKGDIIITTLSGGVGTSTVQFRAYHETIGPMKESAVWIEESPMQSLAWGRRTLSPTSYTQEDPLGLSIEGNEKKFPDDLRDLFPEHCGDLSQENFSPRWFLLEHHHSTSFDDLRAGLSYLRRKVESQKEGQLSFLKANAGSVMDQLDTLMNLRDKYLEDVQQVGTEPLKILDKSVQESIKSSHNLFNEVLQRREKADTTRAALLALSRHKFLFCLPNSIIKNSEKQDYDIVVNDYARAKNLFGNTEVNIFKIVLEEVENRIMEVRQELHTKILKMPQSVDQQKKLIKALLNLEAQQQGTPQSVKVKFFDPAWDAIDARAQYLMQSFKNTFDQFALKETQQTSTKYRDVNAVPMRVQFCEEITDLVSAQLPDIWRLGQAYFTGELRGIHDPKPGNFKHLILNSIEKFCNYLRAAVMSASGQKLALLSSQGIQWPQTSYSIISNFLTWLPQCLRYVRISYAALIRLDLPNEPLDIIQRLIDEIRLFCLSTIFKKSVDKIKRLGEKENWEMGVLDFPGATFLPSFLEEILNDTLEEGQNTCLSPEIRENVLLKLHSDEHREISVRLEEMLRIFCNVIDELVQQRYDDENQAPPTISQLIGFPNKELLSMTDDKNASIPWEQRLLCCLANCAYCDKIFFPHIGNVLKKYGYPEFTLAIKASQTTINGIFINLLDTYVEHKGDPLVGTIEPSMYIGNFQWNNVKRNGKLRPYAYECCDNLVGVYAEIYAVSPFLLRPILTPITQTVAEELARLMSCVTDFSVDGAIQAHTDIRVIKEALQLYSNETAKSFFREALEVIPQLQPEQVRHVNEVVNNVKRDMKLQLMCFSIANP